MSFVKQNFKNGMVLTAEHLNHIEDGIFEAVNMITDPENNPLSEGDVISVPIAIEIGGISSTDGSNVDKTDRIRTAGHVDVTAGATVKISASADSEEDLRIIYYDSAKAFLSKAYVTRNTSFTIPSGAAYLRFYDSSTTDTSIAFRLVSGGAGTKAEFKKIFINGHGYVIYGANIDDATMHKIVIEALGLNENEYNITEIKAPTKSPKEATLCLMNKGNGYVQFVDFSSMNYKLEGQGTVKIVNQTRGSTPLPIFEIGFNNGKGAGRVPKLSVHPDAVPMSLTSHGLEIARSNKYQKEHDADALVTVDLADLYDKVNLIYDALVNNGTITDITNTIVSPHEPCIEYGIINIDTGVDESAIAGVRTRDYIPCTAGKSYTFTTKDDAVWSLVFYDANKTAISNQSITQGSVVAAPSGASYMRLYNGTSVDPGETLLISF